MKLPIGSRIVPGAALAASLALAAGLILAACQLVKTECDGECQEDWLDGSQIDDDCLDTSIVKCLISDRLPAPTEAQKESLQVIVAVHGYSASSFEWGELPAYLDTTPEYSRIAVSRVVLGGHGRDLGDFRTATWKDWGRPILEEYDTLSALGYKHISFACMSAGCALLMQYLSDGAFGDRPAPEWIFLIDPLVLPADKLLSTIDIAGPILGNSPDEGSAEENKHWYVNRPEETLEQLYALMNVVKNRLEDGFRLPPGTEAMVRKSKHDKSADPAGALLVYKGMRKADGSHVDVKLVDSRLHDFTRLALRKQKLAAADTALQIATFREMADRVLK
jgi:carboxylesterase